MKITKEEWILAGSFALLGIIFSSKTWILFLNTLSPTLGFGVYYIIVFFALLILSKFGLVVFNVKVRSFKQLLGTALILFAFFLIFNFESSWVTHVVNQNTNSTQVSNIFYGSEDGMAFDNILNYIANGNYELARWITFGGLVFLIVLLAGILLDKKPDLSGTT